MRAHRLTAGHPCVSRRHRVRSTTGVQRRGTAKAAGSIPAGSTKRDGMSQGGEVHSQCACGRFDSDPFHESTEAPSAVGPRANSARVREIATTGYSRQAIVVVSQQVDLRPGKAAIRVRTPATAPTRATRRSWPATATRREGGSIPSARSTCLWGIGPARGHIRRRQTRPAKGRQDDGYHKLKTCIPPILPTGKIAPREGRLGPRSSRSGILFRGASACPPPPRVAGFRPGFVVPRKTTRNASVPLERDPAS
jgi:hypothetical protein